MNIHSFHNSKTISQKEFFYFQQVQLSPGLLKYPVFSLTNCFFAGIFDW